MHLLFPFSGPFTCASPVPSRIQRRSSGPFFICLQVWPIFICHYIYVHWACFWIVSCCMTAALCALAFAFPVPLCVTPSYLYFFFLVILLPGIAIYPIAKGIWYSETSVSHKKKFDESNPQHVNGGKLQVVFSLVFYCRIYFICLPRVHAIKVDVYSSKSNPKTKYKIFKTRGTSVAKFRDAAEEDVHYVTLQINTKKTDGLWTSICQSDSCPLNYIRGKKASHSCVPAVTWDRCSFSQRKGTYTSPLTTHKTHKKRHFLAHNTHFPQGSSLK